MTLTDTTAGGTWSSSAPTIASVDASTGVVAGLAAGTAIITYTAGAGSATLTVTILHAYTPAIYLTLSPGGGVGSSVADTFHAHGSGAGSTPFYTWYKNAAVVAAGDTSYSYVISPGDVVCCRITEVNGCGSAMACDTVLIPVISGIEDITNDRGPEIWPNPNDGHLSIRARVSATEKRAEVRVMNVLGQPVYKDSLPVIGGRVEGHINLDEQLPEGVYFLSLVPAQHYVRVVVQR
jgi:hypothetical protein